MTEYEMLPFQEVWIVGQRSDVVGESKLLERTK